MIERDLTEPDRIVGELLQPGGYLKLVELGLEGNYFIELTYFFTYINLNEIKLCADCVSEIDAQQVFGYALYKDGKSTRLSYPLEKYGPDVSGRSFHNGRFVQRIRQKASTLSKYDFF